MNLIESLRGEVVARSVAALGNTWASRRTILFNGPITPAGVVAIGDRLSDAFRAAVTERDQSGVSRAGQHWHEIVTYYFNAVLAGTDAIAVTKKYVPQCLKDALSVTYKGSATALQSDIDLMVIHCPGVGNVGTPKKGRDAARKLFDHECESNFSKLAISLFQLKTNWNDSAQVPMLWNMIYTLTARGQMPQNGFSVGKGTFHLNGLKAFGYAFVTVPTQSDLDAFKPHSMPVSRVAGCSGGAYWGRPTKPGVIKSISEFFVHFFNISQHSFVPPGRLGAAFSEQVRRTGCEIGGPCAVVAESRPDQIALAAFSLFDVPAPPPS